MAESKIKNELKISWDYRTGTTDASGRLTPTSESGNMARINARKVHIINAYSESAPWLILPYIYDSGAYRFVFFKIFNSESMSLVANANVDINFYAIVEP